MASLSLLTPDHYSLLPNVLFEGPDGSVPVAAAKDLHEPPMFRMKKSYSSFTL